jgi:hypothetical protein
MRGQYRKKITFFSMNPPLGSLIVRLVTGAGSPATLASCLSLSLVFTRRKKSSLHREGVTCSTRTWSLFLNIRWHTCLLTSTPMERLVTFQTTPVRPWYTLWGIPFMTAELTLMSTKSPTL